MKPVITMFAGIVLVGMGIATAGEMKMQGHDHPMKDMKKMTATDSGTVKLRDAGTQKTCPVTGDPVDKSVYTDYHGKRIYFCCASCKTTFLKEPEKYLKKISDNGEKPALLALVPQKTCPVMGGAINKEIYYDVNGKRIYVCCAGCIDPIKKDPEKYLQKLEELGEQPEAIQ